MLPQNPSGTKMTTENGEAEEIAVGDGQTFASYPPADSLTSWVEIEKIVSGVLAPAGFEARPFHIGWYNQLVGHRFHLDYPENTLALVIISGPDTFEKCVIPFIQSKPPESLECPKFDPLDGSVKDTFQKLNAQLLARGYDVDFIHDFEHHPNRRPKVLVQTAAHVAGAAEYFHRDRVNNKSPLWLNDSKLFGVAIHPDYGGWFAIRGIFILKNIVSNNENVLCKPPRPIKISNESQIIKLLEEFSTNWKTDVWRDLLPRNIDKKYSQDFIGYLRTEPDKRWEYIKSLPYFKRL